MDPEKNGQRSSNCLWLNLKTKEFAIPKDKGAKGNLSHPEYLVSWIKRLLKMKPLSQTVYNVNLHVDNILIVFWNKKLPLPFLENNW